MRAALLVLLCLLGGCDRSSSDSIKNFEGRWISPPFAELATDAVDEMIEALRAGDANSLADSLSDEDRAEMLELSDEEFREMIVGSIERSLGIAEIRFVVEISFPDRLTISMMINGEEIPGSDETGQFEMTEREILFRTEEETRVIYLGDGCLKVRNEEHGNYPRFITLFREKGKD